MFENKHFSFIFSIFIVVQVVRWFEQSLPDGPAGPAVRTALPAGQQAAVSRAPLPPKTTRKTKQN